MSTPTNSRSLEEVIVSVSYPRDPQLSPDGRWVAYTVTPYGQEGEHPDGSIWLAPSDASEDVRQFTFGEGHDGQPRWSPDGRSLALLSDRAERGVAALYLMSVDGGEARELVRRKRSIELFEWSPDGRFIAFTAPDDPTEEEERRKEERDDANVYGERWQYVRLHLLDIESGSVRTLLGGDQHVFEVAWSPGSDRIACLVRSTPELESRVQSAIWTIGLAEDDPSHICDVPGWVGANLGWSSDGKRLVFIGPHERTMSGLTVYAVDASGGEPLVVGPTASEEACGLRVNPVPGMSRPIAAIARGLTTSLEWIDLDSGERELICQPEAGDIAEDFSVVLPHDGEPRFAVIRSTGSEPPEVHAGPPGALRKLSDHHAPLRRFTFGPQEPFYWTASDGLEMDGLLIHPPGAGEGPFPTIVHIHGGPYARFTDGWNLSPLHWAQWLAVSGFAVLMPNYRGGEGRGNDFAKWGHGGVGDMEFDDIMTAVDVAIERGIADPDRLGLGGWSQGGFLTAWAVTQTHRFKAGVMGAGVSDWGMMVMTSDVPTIESMLGGGKPWDGPGPHRFMQHSPISYARHAETPLLILHGEDDARVPMSQAIGFHRALRETGVETELVTYPREGHGVRERNHQLDVMRRGRDWFMKHLFVG